MYIDPNTGGMLFQILATVFALFTGAVLIFSSRIRAGVASLKRRMRGDSAPVDTHEPDAEQS